MNHTKLAWTVVMAAFAVSMGAAPVAAKGNGGGPKVKAPKPAAAAKAKPATVKAKAQTPKVKSANAVKPANAAKPAKTAKAQSGATTPTLTSANRESQSPFSSANGGTPTDTDPAPTVRLNKAQQLLLKNNNLRMKVQTRLNGADPIAAASGFRNLGQFVAAVNASYTNTNVPFRSLKALMTGPEKMSLGQAVKQLKGLDPAAANTVANTAMAQADADILAAR
jgi:hypothetical protein